MAYDINKLKAISNRTASVVTEKVNNRQSMVDTRFWTLVGDDKTKTGQALIRFLPNLEENKLPYVQTFSYYIHCENGWYINKSRKTIGYPDAPEADPMNEYIRGLWRKAKEDNDENLMNNLRNNYRERMQYISNILVINDPQHPENNGKVFLFAYGKKIFDKIIARCNDDGLGDFCNIYDWTSGANFKLRKKMVDKFPNYDSSEFTSPSALSDEEIARVANEMYDLDEFRDPKNFKSYEELKARLEKVTNIADVFSQQVPKNSFASAKAKVESEDDDPPFELEPKKASEPELKSPWDDEEIDFDSLNSQLDEEVK